MTSIKRISRWSPFPEASSVPSSRFKVATTIRTDLDFGGSHRVNSDLDRDTRYSGKHQELSECESGASRSHVSKHNWLGTILTPSSGFRGGRERTAELVGLARWVSSGCDLGPVLPPGPRLTWTRTSAARLKEPRPRRRAGAREGSFRSHCPLSFSIISSFSDGFSSDWVFPVTSMLLL